MAQMHRFEVIVLNDSGEPVSGASVEMRKRGATANTSGTLTDITVHHVGAIVSGDTVAVDLGLTTRSVTGVAGPTTPTVSVAIGLTVTNDVSRLTVTSPLPTIYNDADGVEAKANPLTTDANGMAYCYAPFAALDAAIAVTNAGSAPHGPATPVLRTDIAGTGGTHIKSDIIDSNAADIGHIWNTLRALVTDATKIGSWQVNDVEKASLDRDGRMTLGDGLRVLAGGIDIDAGGLNIDAGGLTVVAGSVSLPAGSLATATLAANAVHPAPVRADAAAADSAVNTTESTRISTTYTPTSGNVGVRVVVNLPYAMVAEGTGYAEIRLYIGGAIKAKGVFGHWTVSATDMNSSGTVSFEWIEPTMAASLTTFEVRDIKLTRGGGTTATIQYDGASSYAGYMFISELKK